MKRLAIVFSSILIMIMFFNGCSFQGSTKAKDIIGDIINSEYNKSPEGRSEEITKKIVKAFENEDGSKVRELFAKNIIKKYENFDKDLKNAFHYYNISNFKPEYECVGEEATTDNGNIVRFVSYSVDLISDNNSYTITLDICTDDDNDSSNIGIWSLFISKGEFVGNESYYDTMEKCEKNRFGIYCV